MFFPLLLNSASMFPFPLALGCRMLKLLLLYYLKLLLMYQWNLFLLYHWKIPLLYHWKATHNIILEGVLSVPLEAALKPLICRRTKIVIIDREKMCSTK